MTVQDADEGDTTTSRETLIDAAERIEAVQPDGVGIQEVVGDKGYHSNQSLVDLEAVGVRVATQIEACFARFRRLPIAMCTA